MSELLASELALWPLDREQRNFVQQATTELDEDQVDALLHVLWEAEAEVRACADFLERWTERRSGNRQPRRRQSNLEIRPLRDGVVIRPIEPDTSSTRVIVLADTTQERPMEGEVLAVGRGNRDGRGKLVAPDVKPGDRVLFYKWSAVEVRINGDELLIVRESEIMGVLARGVGIEEAAEPSAEIRTRRSVNQ